jgi:hypothetical protein
MTLARWSAVVLSRAFRGLSGLTRFLVEKELLSFHLVRE